MRLLVLLIGGALVQEARAQDGVSPAKASAVAPSDLPANGWVVVEVGRIQVAPTHPGTTLNWDGPQPDPGDTCAKLGRLAALIPGGGTGVSLAMSTACQLGEVQVQRSPELPDLFVAIRGDHGGFATTVTTDTTTKDFRQAFVLPTARIPADGLRVTVLDYDGDRNEPEEIGELRVSRADIARAAFDHTLVSPKDDTGGIARAELKFGVTTESKPETGTLQFDVRKPVSATPWRVYAGQVMFIRARGSYTVAKPGLLSTVPHTPITPSGFSGATGRSYNLRKLGFENAPHASAVAVIGDGQRLFGIPVGACAGVVVPYSGIVEVGINDGHVEDNEGSVTFDARVYNATPEDWLKAGKLLPCTGSFAE